MNPLPSANVMSTAESLTGPAGEIAIHQIRRRPAFLSRRVVATLFWRRLAPDTAAPRINRAMASGHACARWPEAPRGS